MALILSSAAFSHNAPIPARYTCDGKNISPPLAWSGVPEGTKSLALIIDDPDAPWGTFVHWVLYNIPPTTQELAEAAADGKLPSGAQVGVNDSHRTGFLSACPPKGRHRYVHHLYALDTVLPDLDKPTRAELEKAMKGHILATAELVGTYKRIH